MQGREVRQSLKLGRRVYGTHMVDAAHPEQIQWLVDGQLDFVFICTEHIPIDREKVNWMCHMFACHGVSPIVRIPYPSGRWAGMMLDGGAQGIVAPYVETIAEVDEVIGAVRYRPVKGKFLNELIHGERKLTTKMAAYLEEFNRDTYLIIGIESIHAIENLESLICRDEVDGVFLGPHDISCSMEIPEEFDNPIFQDTIREVVIECRRLGKGVGIHTNYEIEFNQLMLDVGLNFVLHGSDMVHSMNMLQRDFAKLRSLHGDVYERGTNLPHEQGAKPAI